MITVTIDVGSFFAGLVLGVIVMGIVWMVSI